MRIYVRETPNRLSRSARFLAGVLLTSAAAITVAALWSERPGYTIVPFLFIGVCCALGARFGAAAAMFGSCVAAVIFSWLLFAPVGSLRIAKMEDRTSLAWMVLGSTVGSFLLFPAAMRPDTDEAEQPNDDRSRAA